MNEIQFVAMKISQVYDERKPCPQHYAIGCDVCHQQAWLALVHCGLIEKIYSNEGSCFRLSKKGFKELEQTE